MLLFAPPARVSDLSTTPSRAALTQTEPRGLMLLLAPPARVSDLSTAPSRAALAQTDPRDTRRSEVLREVVGGGDGSGDAIAGSVEAGVGAAWWDARGPFFKCASTPPVLPAASTTFPMLFFLHNATDLLERSSLFDWLQFNTLGLLCAAFSDFRTNCATAGVLSNFSFS